MAQGPRYETRNLSAATWPDFEALFLKHNGVWGGCWCMYGHGRGTFRIRGHAEEHRNAKRALVLAGKSHGVLVYLRGKPVGWCQFGPREELPRMDSGRNYRKLGLHERAGPFWRITCFFVDRDHRRQGVASAGLRGALAAIRESGGGVVEAYPVVAGAFSAIYYGTEAMFRREGFEVVARLGKNQVVVRKGVQPSLGAQAGGIEPPSPA